MEGMCIMQVNRIQSNNYNASFGRLGGYASSSISASNIGEALDSYCRSVRSNRSCRRGRGSVKDLVENLIDKCDKSELKEIAENLEKKLRTPNVDTSWL